MTYANIKDPQYAQSIELYRLALAQEIRKVEPEPEEDGVYASHDIGWIGGKK